MHRLGAGGGAGCCRRERLGRPRWIAASGAHAGRRHCIARVVDSGRWIQFGETLAAREISFALFKGGECVVSVCTTSVFANGSVVLARSWRPVGMICAPITIPSNPTRATIGGAGERTRIRLYIEPARMPPRSERI